MSGGAASLTNEMTPSSVAEQGFYFYFCAFFFINLFTDKVIDKPAVCVLGCVRQQRTAVTKAIKMTKVN